MTEKKVGFRRMSAQAVLEKTGKGWQEWFAILDEFCRKGTEHSLIAKHLQDYHGLRPWWAQAITIRYNGNVD